MTRASIVKCLILCVATTNAMCDTRSGKKLFGNYWLCALLVLYKYDIICQNEDIKTANSRKQQRRVHNKAGNAKHNKQAHSKAGLAKSQIENKKRASE